MKITPNKIVSAEYELYVDAETEGAELELMERATAEQPLEFIFGVGMMLPKFEEMLYGLEAGELFEFTLETDEAYGDFIEENVIDLDRAVFEIDGKFDAEMIFEGNIVPLMDTEGNRMSAAVIEVTADKVKVDLNHPLAGETLHFKGKILEVREPTPQELAAVMGGSGCGGCGSHEEKSGCGGCG
jgi:FKBP-type peptidyl-prolyl cis-trans isomerase SlyD